MRIFNTILFLLITTICFGQLAGTANQLYYDQERTIGNFVRLNFSAQFLTPPDRFGEVTLSPTWQKFPYSEPQGDMDAYLFKMKERGIYIMVNYLNGFNKKYNVHLKAVPRDAPNLDPMDMSSYDITKKILQQITLRWGSVKNDALIDIADNATSYPGNPQTKVSGLNLIDAIQIFNELDNPGWFDNGYETTMDAQTLAHVTHYLVQAIWEIDPNMAIIAMPTSDWKPVYWQDFFHTWQMNYGQFPHYNPETNTGIAISFNYYIKCKGSQPCRVDKPDRAIPPIRDKINAWLEVHGAYAFISEHGCNEPIQADLGCPNYIGDNQAKFYIQSTDEWVQGRILGSTMYQGRDDPNEWRFANTGLCIKDGNASPKRAWYEVKEYWEEHYPPVTFGDTIIPPGDTVIVPIDTVGTVYDTTTIIVLDTLYYLRVDTVYFGEIDFKGIEKVNINVR